MGFRNGSYATVWSVEDKGKFCKVRISTSRKNKDTNTYTQDFSAFCSFIGTAKAKAEKLHEKDRIQLKEVESTTDFNKETGKEYHYYTVFDFEPAESGGGKPSKPEDSIPDGTADEDELPFA